MAEIFNGNGKTIQRDLEDIRTYFSDNRERLGPKDIVYIRNRKGYIFDNKDDVTKRKNVKDIIGNEMLNYVPLNHSGVFLTKIWDLSELIRN